MQTKKMSIIESIVNVIIGYGVAVAAQVIVFPWFGIETCLSDNLKIGVIFTFVSLVRTYAVRRVFNKLHQPKLFKIENEIIQQGDFVYWDGKKLSKTPSENAIKIDRSKIIL